MLLLALLAPSILAALLALAVRPYRWAVGWAGAWLALVSLGAALTIASHAAAGGAAPTLGPGELLRADSLSALFMVCVAAVATLVLFLSPGLGQGGEFDLAQLRRYHLFINLFVFAMLSALSANNVGIMWVAVEASTIFSAVLIPLTLTKASVEASWKYILIGSIGIALAFAGTVLGYFDFVALSGRAENALNWPVLLAAAPGLHPEVMRLAFVFLLVGYGTKAGIAPMHTWLPDAHSEAPAPLSALLSSVLLPVALYAILRWKVVADATLGGGYTDNLLLTLGFLSLLVASFSVVLSRNYKRLLAYSSIEHIGLICLGAGLGPLGMFAALLHVVNHAIVKSMLFLLSGRVSHRYHTTQIRGVSGLLAVMPWTGTLFAVGIMALVGLPPFGLFVSELALFRAGFAAHRPWLMGAVLALLAVAFVSFLHHLNKMLYGEPPPSLSEVAAPEPLSWRTAALCLSVAALVVLGLALPAPLVTLLNQSVAIVTKP